MTNYGRIRGQERPKEIEITQTSVFIASNIEPFEETIDDRQISGFEYNYVGYGKDEYIGVLAAENAKMQDIIIETQLALCELYESIEG